MVVESPDFHKWDAANVAKYIVEHLSTYYPEAVEPMNANILKENVDGKRLKALIESPTVFANVMQQLLPPDAAAAMRFLLSIPSKLQLCNKIVFDQLALFRRLVNHDTSFPPEDFWCIEKNGWPYYCPSGWTRYAMVPNIEGIDLDDIFNNWHVGYHGTGDGNINGIIKHGLLPFNYKLPSGEKIENLHGKAGANDQAPAIYISPSIRYSSHWVYTNPQQLPKSSNYLLTVFQVRVRPGKYTVQGNTLWKDGWPDLKVLFDPLFGQDELEWLVRNPADVCITGLMVKIVSTEPRTYLTEYFERRKSLQSVPRDPANNVTWLWNCGKNTLSRDGPWKPYDTEVSQRIEKAFQAYRDVVYLGQLHGNPYFIHFPSMLQRRADGELNGEKNWQIRVVKRQAL